MSRPRHAVASGDGTRRSVTMLIAVGFLAVGLLLAEAALPPAAGQQGGLAEVERGDLATAYCPVVLGEGDRAAVVVAAVGDEASEVALLRHTGDGETEVAAEEVLEPGQRVVVTAEGGAPVTVRSRGGQVTAAWSISGERSAAAPCVDEPADEFYLAGLDTSLGAQASLHLFNPFTIDAVVRVRFGTSEGPSELVRTENVAVPAGGTATLDLTDLQPEEPELGVRVETVTGRVVAQGEVERTRVDEIDEGPQGRALVPASTTLSEEAYFAQATIDEQWSSRLAIYNPNDREAAVRVHATDPDPETPVEEVPVPAGGVAPVDLAGRSQSRSFGLRVESLNELPVLVARVESKTNDPSALAVPLAAGAPSTRWVTAGTTRDRIDALTVYNPGDEAVNVDATMGGVSVERWRGRLIGASARHILYLDDLETSWPAVVEADGPIIVEVISGLRLAEEAIEEQTEADDAEDEGDDAEDEGDDAEAEPDAIDDRIPELADLSRVIGLTRPGQRPEPTVTVPRVRRDESLRLTPVVPAEER